MTSTPPSPTRHSPASSSSTVGQARVAGALGLAHLVLLIGGLVLSGGGALIEDGTAGIEEAYRDGNLTTILGGWLIESVGFVLLVPVVVFLARSLGRSTPAGRWAAQTGLVLATTYVAITLAVGLPAGAAAALGVQHGLDVDAGAALNSMRVFAYLMSLLCLGGFVICVGVSALADGLHRRWFGYFGLATGAALVAAPPMAAVALQDIPTLVHLVWWVGVCVILLRDTSATTAGFTQSTAPAADLRQA